MVCDREALSCRVWKGKRKVRRKMDGKKDEGDYGEVSSTPQIYGCLAPLATSS
jgi:hypothetical protein